MSATNNLASIPFGSLIGGPLEAAVEAQAAAAAATVDFIERIGFVKDGNGQPTPEIRNVTFSYKKLEEGEEKNFDLTVPVLTIVPIPYLAIEDMTIDFTARLSDVVTTDESTSSQVGASLALGGKRVKFRAGYSRTHKKESKSQSSAEYTMDIHVRAGTQDIPTGLGRILDILEGVILEKEQESTDSGSGTDPGTGSGLTAGSMSARERLPANTMSK